MQLSVSIFDVNKKPIIIRQGADVTLVRTTKKYPHWMAFVVSLLVFFPLAIALLYMTESRHHVLIDSVGYELDKDNYNSMVLLATKGA